VKHPSLVGAPAILTRELKRRRSISPEHPA
jgi:hypothetical protein